MRKHAVKKSIGLSRMQNLVILTAVAVCVALALATVAFANHSWNGYHWARTANPFTLKLGDNVSSTWDPILATTSYDWSLTPSVLVTTIVAGQSRGNCRPTAGRV